MREIDSDGVPKGRNSRKFKLYYNRKYYPPKYVISLANKYANGTALASSEFSGGQQSNNFLERLGFEVVGLPPVFCKPISVPEKPTERKGKHDERCPECKRTIEMMLKEIYGTVKSSHKFEVSTRPEDYKDTLLHKNLQEIFKILQHHRGHKEFVKARSLPRCDFFIPTPGFVVEFDESQHFTIPRRLSLQNYPDDLKLGFSLTKWIPLCDETKAKDADPPYRDEQRAWYDTLRDFLSVSKGLEPTVRLYYNEVQWCSLDVNDPEDVRRFKNLTERRKKYGSVATVILQSNAKYDNHERMKVLPQIVDSVVRHTERNCVILFPGGWFSAGKQEARVLYKCVEENVRDILRKKEGNIVCLGIDGRVDEYAKDQIGVAVSKNGVEAIGRKFHPAPREKGHVELAKDYSSHEDGRPRIFELDGRKYFLSACYDSFGLRRKRIPNCGIDVVLDLVHGFYPKGEGGSGDVYFAKHGFAGAAKQWNCLVFGAAVFFNRKIPENWPSGVYWNQGEKSTRKWRYGDNPIKWIKDSRLEIPEGIALVRIYDLEEIWEQVF